MCEKRINYDVEALARKSQFLYRITVACSKPSMRINNLKVCLGYLCLGLNIIKYSRDRTLQPFGFKPIVISIRVRPIINLPLQDEPEVSSNSSHTAIAAISNSSITAIAASSKNSITDKTSCLPAYLPVFLPASDLPACLFDLSSSMRLPLS